MNGYDNDTKEIVKDIKYKLLNEFNEQVPVFLEPYMKYFSLEDVRKIIDKVCK